MNDSSETPDPKGPPAAAAGRRPSDPPLPRDDGTVSTDSIVPPVTVVSPEPVVAGATVKKPELIDRVVAQSGVKKRDAKPVVEAMLGVLGEMLSDGREMQVPPLGKLMVGKRKEVSGGEVLNLRLRRTGGAAPGPKSQSGPDEKGPEPGDDAEGAD
ncbi:HU family DNA-binding protein [Tropicimonas sp. IMCC34011]|uniref:HU family DNA-binding protein n=1 Tax=Tropicimonas sp. IMCC34011 TaxID=2248759 RepID=UPI000E24C4EE|nr:HU family DNA-binding protein [Tropicimonas sp. IMCC34011]